MSWNPDYPIEALPCHMPGYENPCPDCPLDECPYKEG